MITLSKMLSMQSDILDGKRVKLVRHKDNRAEFREVMKSKELLLGDYQNIQPKHCFKDCDYIVVFIGLERRKSVMVATYKVNGVQEINKHFHYDLEEISDFAVYNDRLIIDWGGAERAWHQWFPQNDKEVLQLTPEGYVGEFPGLLNFTLDFEELCELTAHPDANADWMHHLSSVNGIYLILDNKTGMQYIGSACGSKGLWGRWCEYAGTKGAGNNKELVALESKEHGYAKNFQFSVLQSLPSNLTSKDVVVYENLYKRKLGSRAFGLNAN